MKYISLPKLLSAALFVATCCLLPGSAEAGFGKSGGSHGGGHVSSSSHPISSAPTAGGSHYHTASSPNTSTTWYPGAYRTGVYGSGYGYSPYAGCWGDPLCPRYAWGFGYAPLWAWGTTYYAQPVYTPAPDTLQLEPERPLITTVGMDGQAYRGGGGGLGLTVGFEKNRWGLEGRYTGILTPSGDPSGGTDAIHLLDVHATYALLSGEHGRLRVGAGLDSAFAPDVTFAGPSLSASAALGLIGPLGLEGSIDVVPYPFTKVDWNAGVALGFGAFGVRAGWRRIYLNDNGYVDGTAHSDVFSGPYAAVALAL